ncbi:histone H4 [Colletotrichum musicola]|uniref:Histone H4 n=1 Tax=Colletotrichum musicola TaxID=2175873 RepID=A0A8H6KL01_9PEZI|nr:histone H4 [Colletotrichum musicola]
MPPSKISRGGPAAVKKGIADKVPSGGGKGKTILQGAKRHRKAIYHQAHAYLKVRKIMKDTIRGITKPAIRRLARRGGVKRISAMIYDDARAALMDHLKVIIKDCVLYMESRNAKTITIHDVLHSLRRIGRPIYGFDPETFVEHKGRKAAGPAHH